jgi:hypothetical protein
MRMGGEAMRESVEQTRDVTLKMVDESRKVVESMVAAASHKPE